MTAPFVRELCGYRGDRPNTSDKNDRLSIEIGRELFARLGVLASTPEPLNVGALVASRVAADLQTLRPDLEISENRRASDFVQYEHMTAMRNIRAVLHDLRYETTDTEERVRRLLELVAVESLLKVDIAIAQPRPDGASRLLAAFSSKWSLRTDRGQDCISQGTKLVGQRRGQMPHYAVITMEPRPSMLALVADGSGSVDFVYHLALPELRKTVEEMAEGRRDGKRWSPWVTLRRLIAQGRIRDYDDLVSAVCDLPISRSSTMEG